ncbi:MAG TPA: hypothetical protein EYQ22_04795 [Gammaproteobacteria bacterium]|nr:hypothetical protein [Gammaproteobacteria bacterium]HIK70344.1 hypothetical protein [Pseudomonadales bacterium]
MDLTNQQQQNKQVLSQLESDGFSLVHRLCEPALTEHLLKVSREIEADIKKSLGTKKIGIGSRAGYREIVQRSPGRWDIPITSDQFAIDHQQMPWWTFITDILGQDAEHAFSGVVSSEPVSPEQHWHIDSPHEATEHLPAHAINVLIALTDLPLVMGPTELARGSHVLSNHLANPTLVSDQLVYQHAGTSPVLLVNGACEAEPEYCSSAMSAGSGLIFDDRILHRGMANLSANTRHVAYFSYRRKGYLPYTHFESPRSIFDS